MTPRASHPTRSGRPDRAARAGRGADEPAGSAGTPGAGIAELERVLDAIDGSGYGGYKRLVGSYDVGPARLIVDRTQVDPYAPPSLMRVVIDREAAGFPPELLTDRLGRLAVADQLHRRIRDLLGSEELPGGGSAVRAVHIGSIGQEVLERTNVHITDSVIEARLTVSLPAAGRRIRGREAAQILTRTLPALAERALIFAHLDADALTAAADLLRDQEHLRAELRSRGLVAFVGDGAILPRRAGDSDLPLESEAVPFTSPESLRVTMNLPSGRTVTGMGVGEGITVIVGGGYHGKSTLLRAIERGVYPHIDGDGRQWVLTRADAVAIRAEDGRSVRDVDISPFIGHLPTGTDTRRFSTSNASGSTSQAANLVEALEAGTTALLIDEDTSATNFMIRDARMRALIPADREPITPFVDRVRPLHTDLGVSTVLVAGGSGAFFDTADCVIAMDSYIPRDATAEARRIAEADPDPQPHRTPAPPLTPPAPRVPEAGTLDPASRKPATARGRELIRAGEQVIDLAALAQLVAAPQTEGIAHALDHLGRMFDGEVSLAEAVAALDQRIDVDGLDVLAVHRGHPGHFARPRPQEICAAVNRLRELRCR